MVAGVAVVPPGTPQASLYDFRVAKTVLMGLEYVRKHLGPRLDVAKEEHTVVTKHGQTKGVVVDMDWYRRARKALGEPTDL